MSCRAWGKRVAWAGCRHRERGAPRLSLSYPHLSWNGFHSISSWRVVSAPLLVPVAIHSPVLSLPSHSLTHALTVGPGSAPLLLGGHAPLQGRSYRARGTRGAVHCGQGCFLCDIILYIIVTRWRVYLYLILWEFTRDCILFCFLIMYFLGDGTLGFCCSPPYWFAPIVLSGLLYITSIFRCAEEHGHKLAWYEAKPPARLFSICSRVFVCLLLCMCLFVFL